MRNRVGPPRSEVPPQRVTTAAGTSDSLPAFRRGHGSTGRGSPLPAPTARAPRPQRLVPAGGRDRPPHPPVPPRPSGGRRRGRRRTPRKGRGEGSLAARLAAGAAAPGAPRQPAPGAAGPSAPGPEPGALLTSMETRQPCMALKPKWSGRGPSPAPSPELFTVLGCDK